MSAKIIRRAIMMSFSAAFLLPVLFLQPASAGFIANRYGSGVAVSPEMMQAIDVIVKEHAKMMRHRRVQH